MLMGATKLTVLVHSVSAPLGHHSCHIPKLKKQQRQSGHVGLVLRQQPPIRSLQ